MVLEIFRKPKYVTVRPEKTETTQGNERRDIPEGLWVKCSRCNEILYTKELDKNFKVCHKCNFHFRLNAQERIHMTLDEGSFQERDNELITLNPLNFPDYQEKIQSAQKATELKEAVVTGEGTIGGNPVVIGVMDSHFIMGSMGSVVGEKIARAIERAIEKKLPVVLFSTSGGARMQEGILSLMQMAKTAAALAKLDEAGLLYVAVLTDPTTGGVTASFASLGDIIIAEPGALIGFTGPRVIEQTIRQKLPEGFQRAEFLRKHGMVDMIVNRPQLKDTLANILSLHGTN
ncbi:acetyl-CoA carboxylase carboxyltransferase subunit alpha [Desulforamulus reducens MI-1]|uniref:Acetyl-coenzyme A carboxylase carboxyl transferase subunit beta n=1 Tax=Desulforamulus reducens (strain ATCC BAA-1160 / DSM 100696 / MI-1) TaxID=349161 RepID=ACCD_DESRM|nr:acetyl-CoA carboxylase, carboxyltransferase subunit beta [Desulforamulus reducens]A4J6X2.1 RecName: Full=Acetyl-coenzyme A carboxylase carboxyl transferase subunit beta; Short=ACCase subunit beta; Short=Acetyl-CoA carboxylase carboxyltransferase subunit beta [Desulforamulus reducens MI-1]ABO50825.1 acetyl-CoA carboxylase carboxyltransferase subunit alpha [Desulforamulus reducens MI-1]